MAVSKKKVDKLVKEYLRVKELKEQYAKYEKQYKEELLKYENYINKKDYPIEIVTVETIILNPAIVWKAIKSVPKFLKVVSINKTALSKLLDKKTMASIEAQCEVKTSKRITLRKKTKK